MCAQLDTLNRRRAAIELELRDWNATSVLGAAPIRWLLGDERSTTGISETEWQSAELRASATVANLTGVLLPMLLGFLGACAYVFRDLDRQVRTWTLHRGAAAHGVMRLLLGITLGGLLSVFWTSNTDPRIDGVSLSLAALAFLVGFGVEIVFQTLDTAIAVVANKIAR